MMKMSFFYEKNDKFEHKNIYDTNEIYPLEILKMGN